MSRVILHADANSFYATVECLYRPEVQGRPLSVCGDPEKRHGIVLASNQLAKKCGVKTGMAVWQAKQACPGLIAVPPDFALYKHFSHMLRDIYEEYRGSALSSRSCDGLNSGVGFTTASRFRT